MSELSNNPPLRKKGLTLYHNLLESQLDAAFGSVSEAISANTSAISSIIDPETGLLSQKANKSDIPTTLPANGGNADTFDNKHANQFVQWLGMITAIEIVDNPNFPIAYEGNIPKETAAAVGLLNCYYHIKYFRHRDVGSVGWGAQIAIPLTEKTAKPMYRMCCNEATEWDTWHSFADGGNADTFGGLNTGYFYIHHGDVPDNDCNNARGMGTYNAVPETINTPFSGYWNIIVEYAANGNWIKQTATYCDKANPLTYCRLFINEGDWGSWARVNDGGNALTLGGIVASELERVRTAIVGGETVGATYTALQTKVGDRILRAQVDATAGFERIMLWISTDGGATWTEIPLGNAATVNGLTVQTAVPANAKFTDTTYGIASTSTNGLVSTGTQHFGGYKTVPMLGLRTTGTVGTQPSSDIVTHLFFTNADVNAPFGEMKNCIRSTAFTTGEVFTTINSYSNGRTGSCELKVVATNDNSGNYVTISDPTVSSSASCLRKLASGTAEKNTTNCPSGAWYGKHD